MVSYTDGLVPRLMRSDTIKVIRNIFYIKVEKFWLPELGLKNKSVPFYICPLLYLWSMTPPYTVNFIIAGSLT